MPQAKPSPRGMTISGRGIKHDVDRRPTKKEARARLLNVPKPLRIARRVSRRVPPNPFLIPFYAIELAEVLIEIDPLDRIQD